MHKNGLLDSKDAEDDELPQQTVVQDEYIEYIYPSFICKDYMWVLKKEQGANCMKS